MFGFLPFVLGFVFYRFIFVVLYIFSALYDLLDFIVC